MPLLSPCKQQKHEFVKTDICYAYCLFRHVRVLYNIQYTTMVNYRIMSVLHKIYVLIYECFSSKM